MVSGADPVAIGLVASLARPGGNVTGLSLMSAELAGKRLQLLKEASGGLGRVAVLWNALKRLAAGYSAGEKTALFSGTAQRVYRLAI